MPQALAVVHEAVTEGNSALAAGDVAGAAKQAAAVRGMMAVLGLDPLDEHWSGPGGDEGLRPVVDALVAVALRQRQAARERKDYAEADAIRDGLLDAGIADRGHPARPAVGAAPVSGGQGRRGAGGRTKSGKPRPGTGGYGKRRLEGKGPTPPAHLRPGHPAQRRAGRVRGSPQRERHRRTGPGRGGSLWS